MSSDFLIMIKITHKDTEVTYSHQMKNFNILELVSNESMTI